MQFRILCLLLLAAAAGQAAAPTDLKTLSFPDSRLPVYGLGWFAEDTPALRRLPHRLKETFREPIWRLAQHTSGGRIRFRTDSTRLVLKARAADTSVMYHITSVAENGYDLYVDGEYAGSAAPGKEGNIVREWRLGNDRRMRDLTLYLPLYKGTTIESIQVDRESELQPPSSFAVPQPVVYYGSSITQGGCASNPALSYQAILGRRLNLDFINLGFSGEGIGDESVARAMTELNPSLIVLDFWANPGVDVYRDRLPVFTAILREKFPKLPLLVVGPLYLPHEKLSAPGKGAEDQKREISERFVEERRKNGDRQIFYLDGRKLISREQGDGYVDGVHPNSLGFRYCADGLEPVIKKLLKLRH